MRKFKAEVLGPDGFVTVHIKPNTKDDVHMIIYPQGGDYFSSKKSAKRAANRIAGKLGYELEWVN